MAILKNPMLLKATPKMLMFGLDTNKYNKPILIISATLKPINGINGLLMLCKIDVKVCKKA